MSTIARFLGFVVVVGLGLGATPAGSPGRRSNDARAAQAADRCLDARHVRDASGTHDCYPYRCRDGACLNRCETTRDCVPSARPGQPISRGYPIVCERHACVPLPPHVVHTAR